jgi:hypothetical protein
MAGKIMKVITGAGALAGAAYTGAGAVFARKLAMPHVYTLAEEELIFAFTEAALAAGQSISSAIISVSMRINPRRTLFSLCIRSPVSKLLIELHLLYYKIMSKSSPI